ncbi:MAG: PAS domain-containing sensor histidine kinase [FCB group bacterium]|nr:PAS domain-containing sensor histidine kinase [FCB group bacterium]MBL7026963.1 PAS domain-containing sensor histidine kinase [Candidatus Neomarinimicrobiota bacterium]MBL7122143.1 PAS domain-containing sensor histidine kinase [Candidatus Neomarinimicrobiota bacterium]
MAELKRHFTDTLEFLPGALIEIDFSNQLVTYMNRMAFFLFGYRPTKEPLAIPIKDIFLNEVEYQRAKKLTESFALDSYEKKIPYTRYEKQELHDFWFKKIDGEPFCGGSQGSFILDDAQLPVGVRLYIRDLTDQRETENALQESEEKYRTLVEFSTDLIFLVDEEGLVLSVNKAAAKSVGGAPEQIQGKQLSQLFPPHIVDNYQESLKAIFQSGKGSSYESSFKLGERTVWIDTSLNPVKGSSGEVSAVLGVSRDITERKLAEIKIEESDSLRELLLDVVTHDLKTPAGVIYGLADMAREYLPDDEIVESIFLSSQRLLGVLENTSLLSQAVFGEQIPKSVLVLNELMLEIGHEFTSQLESTEMSLEIQIPPEIKITANPLIAEVFKNYISNAIKYAHDGKRIIIEAIEGKDSVLIGIKDFGRTIPAENRSLIFERGSQLSHAKKSGRGLGLAIVKRIAKAHNGDVGVEPNQPSGNIFYIRLPQ